MPIEAASRWNTRYHDEARCSFERPRSLLLEFAHLLPSRGIALDLAMGLGGNAGFLLQRGLHVLGVDISQLAVYIAKARLPNLMAVIADLESFYIPLCTFDVIINFLYLQRDLWKTMVHALKPNGILFIETLTEDMHPIHPEINPDFLLKTNELHNVFAQAEMRSWIDILVYREGWQESSKSHPRSVASLVARRRS